MKGNECDISDTIHKKKTHICQTLYLCSSCKTSFTRTEHRCIRPVYITWCDARCAHSVCFQAWQLNHPATSLLLPRQFKFASILRKHDLILDPLHFKVKTLLLSYGNPVCGATTPKKIWWTSHGLLLVHAVLIMHCQSRISYTSLLGTNMPKFHSLDYAAPVSVPFCTSRRRNISFCKKRRQRERSAAASKNATAKTQFSSHHSNFRVTRPGKI